MKSTERTGFEWGKNTSELEGNRGKEGRGGNVVSRVVIPNKLEPTGFSALLGWFRLLWFAALFPFF
jgi:hypothetical protein